jgi:TolB protein
MSSFDPPVRLTRDGSQKFTPHVAGDEVVYAVWGTPKLIQLMRLKLADRTAEPLNKEAAKSELDPALSLDGRYLAFVQLRAPLSLALVIRDRKTGSEAAVPPAPGFAGMRSPTVAPDGSRVLYSFADDAQQHILSVDAKAGDCRTLTTGLGINNWPCFSPDGKRVAFASSRVGKFDIYVMNTDGSAVRRLTDSPCQNIRPRFSPDGRRIAFASRRDGPPRVFVMNADGSNVRRIETGSEADDYPCWRADGKQLVVVSEVAGRHDLYQVNVPG